MPSDLSFSQTEKKIREFWESNHIFEKSAELRSQGRKKNFVFFEGPPTANGRPGIHHFIGRAYKDVFNRYKTMRGYFILRKAGWDTHGLPVELQVEKQLGFKNKKDIEEYGIAKFNKKCKESVWEYKREWEEMTKRMGFWVDLKNAYITYESPYIESIWAILKRIWDKKLLYLAHKVVPYCTRCGTPLSSHEVAQGYKSVTEDSVYLKFKVFGQENTFVLSWTTTPWTLPGNVALAINKNLKYVKIAVVNPAGGKEFLIFAEKRIEKLKELLSGDFKFETSAEISTEDLLKIEYQPLFNTPQLKNEKSYRVYDADFVTADEGTGIVHTAVMYGEDDYNLGTSVDLPKVHTVDEAGKFIGVSEELNSKYVKSPETEKIIINHLKNGGNLLASEPYTHDYPYCWRCDTPLLYYAKNSWFIKMSAVNEQLLKNNQKVNWVPEHLKDGRFGQWLKEGKDWAISRERYWGTPLPIWKCVKCDNQKAIGSVEDMIENASSSGNTYYILRHGFSTRNEGAEKIISSRLEKDTYHLVEEGRKQVERAVKKLARLDHIDEIFVSPFMRTMESAEIAARVLHKEPRVDERLVEIRSGFATEGKSYNDYPEEVRKKTFVQKNEGGESWNDVRRRMVEFMKETEATYRGKKILIISHGDPLWLLEQIAAGLTEEEILKNGSIGPDFGELKKIKWLTIPRDEYGELDLHRPFIDEAVLKCGECGADMKRIPDLIDVWFDSGSMPYAQWHWPFENLRIFDRQFPADFVCEAIDQTRGWFYTLLAISTLLDLGAPYKNVISYSHVLDEKGQKMSKSKGNIILPGDVMDKVGVDAARWYFYSVNSPGDPKYFSFKEAEERLKGFLLTLGNCMRFFELYKSDAGGEIKISGPLDEWIVSKLNGLILGVTEALDAYDFTASSRMIEKFVVEDLSNWWLRRSRKRKEALPLLRHVLLEVSKICAPFIPFTAEDMHMRLHVGQAPGVESVHLHDWPKAEKKLIKPKLEKEMDELRELINLGLAARKEKQIRVRQPLGSSDILGFKKLSAELENLYKEEVNVKEIRWHKAKEGDEKRVEHDFNLTSELIREGYAREIARQIQEMRKEAKYKLDERIYAAWESENEEVISAIEEFGAKITEDTLLEKFDRGHEPSHAFDIEKEFELGEGVKIWLGVRK